MEKYSKVCACVYDIVCVRGGGVMCEGVCVRVCVGGGGEDGIRGKVGERARVCCIRCNQRRMILPIDP